MATTYVHTRMGIIDASGDTYILYPQNTAADVSVSRANNSEIPSTVTNVQLLADALAASAFAVPIDDTSTTSTTKSWSANKINSELSQLNSNLTDTLNNRFDFKLGTPIVLSHLYFTTTPTGGLLYAFGHNHATAIGLYFDNIDGSHATYYAASTSNHDQGNIWFMPKGVRLIIEGAESGAIARFYPFV